jgi:RecB family exonuclease
VSRIRTDAKCPHAFELRYIQRVEKDPDVTEHEEEHGYSALIGSVCHAALEAGYKEALAFGQDVRIDEAEATRLFRAAFIAHNLRDEEAYNDGLRMVRDYFERNPIVVSRLIPNSEGGGIEREFLLPAGEFTIRGFIDLIERVEPGHYEITDHKSGKWLYQDHELRSDLQLSVYGWAIRELFPDAEEVTFKFEMLRHNVPQRATRTREQCIDGVRYLVDRARQIEVREGHPAVLGQLCSWCSVKQHCKAYQDAHKEEKIASLIGLVATDDIDAVSKARSAAYAITKLAEKRYKALDKVIMAKLDAQNNEAVRLEDGWRYKIIQKSYKKYDIARIVKSLNEAGIADIDYNSFCNVTKKKLDELIASLDLSGSQKRLLKVKIEAMAGSKPGKRILDARQTKK